MSQILSVADIASLSGPHIARAWFADLDLPSGTLFVTNATGRHTIGGNTYLGISNPVLGPLVSVGQVDEPQFGQAASVQIVLAGVTAAFIQEFKSVAGEIEGRAASLSWAAFDGETQQIKTALIPVFPFGRLTAPSISWQGIGARAISLTIESIWQAKNFPPGGRWNPASQRSRYAGDKGLDFVGVQITEYWD